MSEDPVETGAIFRMRFRRTITPAEDDAIAREFNALLEASPAPQSGTPKKFKPSRRRKSPTPAKKQHVVAQDDEEDTEAPTATPPKKLKTTPTTKPRAGGQTTAQTTPQTTAQTTRSGRRTFRALDWWKSERLSYNADGDATGIVLGADEDLDPKPRRPRSSASSSS